MFRLIAAIALGLAVPAAASAELPVRTTEGATAGEVSQLAENRVVHLRSGFMFPSKLATLPAAEAVVYGIGDVSVQYTGKGPFNGEPWLTFYVYPASGELGENADIVEEIIVTQWGSQKMATAPAMPAAIADGRSGWFSGVREGKEYVNGYVLVKRGTWFLKARFTMPKELGDEGIKQLVAAIEAAPWSWGPVD